jgi:hypothetical protein
MLPGARQNATPTTTPLPAGAGSNDQWDSLHWLSLSSVEECTSQSHFRCDQGRHSMCPHVPFTMDFGAQRPRVVRSSTSPSLCPCACHQDCPITGQDGAGWPEACTCAGTRSYERRQGTSGPDIAAIARKSFDKARRRHAAKKEFERRARGLDTEEVERLVDVVWAEQDLPPPIPPVKQVLVARAMGTRNRKDELELTADILHGTGKWISNIVGMMNNAGSEQSTKGKPTLPFDESTFLVPRGEGHVQVSLDADVQPRLTPMSDKSIYTMRMGSLVHVALRVGRDDVVEVWELQPTISDSTARLGHLTSFDALTFRPYIAAAERVGQVATCAGMRGDGPEVNWSLYLWLPPNPKR